MKVAYLQAVFKRQVRPEFRPETTHQSQAPPLGMLAPENLEISASTLWVFNVAIENGPFIVFTHKKWWFP